MTTPTPEAVARNTAIEIVDSLYGYTMEFAPSPVGHRGMYRVVEEIIALAFDAFARERKIIAAKAEQDC